MQNLHRTLLKIIKTSLAAEWMVEKDKCIYAVTIPKEIEVEYVFDGMDIIKKTSYGEKTEFTLELRRR